MVSLLPKEPWVLERKMKERGEKGMEGKGREAGKGVQIHILLIKWFLLCTSVSCQ